MSSVTPSQALLLPSSPNDAVEALRRWRSTADAPPLCIQTSGSSGEPKRVLLSATAWSAHAEAVIARLGAPGQWLLNLPPNYVAGIGVILRSLDAGWEPGQWQGNLASSLATMQGSIRYVSLVPTQVVRALRDPRERAAMAAFDAVLVGGGPLRSEVRQEARTAGVNLISTYGMSETCGGCVYDGVPLPGVQVRIADGEEIQVRGPMLFSGYLQDPGRTARAWDGVWLRTNDAGALRGADPNSLELEVLGRLDAMVISGGVKVPPLAVERALWAHPAIADVVVSGVADPEWGQQVVATAVLRPGAEPPPLTELRGLVSPRAWAPQRLRWVPSLPSLPSGKPDRVAVAAAWEAS